MLAGAGIGCVPLFLAAGALRGGAASEVLRDGRDAATAIWIVRRERRLTPARVTALVAFLAARAPSLADLL